LIPAFEGFVGRLTPPDTDIGLGGDVAHYLTDGRLIPDVRKARRAKPSLGLVGPFDRVLGIRADGGG
jgi:hypothetical protein